jgi:formylglycine-generating enzyme required for sulfatase activity
LRVWEARAVFERVQTYVIERLNLSQDQFEALLLSPEQCAGHPDQNLLRAFAIAAPSCLRGLGGRYEGLADQLEQRWRREQGPEDKFWKGFVVREEEFETAQLLDVPQLQAIPFMAARFAELELGPIPFTTAALKSDHTIQESPGTAWGFHDPLQRDHLPFAATAEQADPLALTLVQIPAGSFQMGSPPDEPKRSGDEGPQHEVKLASFFISQAPITQAQWREVALWQSPEGKRWERELKASPSRFQPKDMADREKPLLTRLFQYRFKEEKELSGSFRFLEGEASSYQRPVERVSWEEAMEFCRRLSQRTGRYYTLPSEAQWEYACRAGKSTPFSFGDTITPELANYDGTYTYANGPKGEYREQTTPVGMFPANTWGLQDMHGNVWEWCLDDWHESYEGAPVDGSAWVDGAGGQSSNREGGIRLLRGGSWDAYPWGCRSAHRDHHRPDDANFFIGFRVVCLPQGPSLNA